MNSGTLVASLIMAALLALLIAFVIQMMMRGWQGRARRQAELIGTLPPVPDTVGSPIVEPTRGVYVGCTLAPSWHDRVVVGDLGYRSKAVLTRYPEGIMVQRSGASPIWIPQESIAAVRTERGMVGKAMTTQWHSGHPLAPAVGHRDRPGVSRQRPRRVHPLATGEHPMSRASDDAERSDEEEWR